MSTPSHRLRFAKDALRRRVLADRDALSRRERSDKSAAITERLLALPEILDAGMIMAFWSFGSEVETEPVLARLDLLGKLVALPRVRGREVVAVSYEPGAPLTATSFGAMEPAAGRLVRPEEVDAVVTPGVAFDRRGRRIGYGGGFYDRLLSRIRPSTPAVAIAFSLQVVDEVPAGASDRRVDLIVTEGEVIRCPAA